jgi:hypothetical protein
MNSSGRNVLVIGAGDFATGVIRRLVIAGFGVAATELERPLTVRRLVAFSEAVYRGSHTVEGVTAVASDFGNVGRHMGEGMVPVVVDPEGRLRRTGAFEVIVDARMAKRNIDTKMTDAPVVIGLGPGFEAGKDCHAVIETLRGEDLGRVIYSGKAAANTGFPDAVDLELRNRACLPCGPCGAEAALVPPDIRYCRSTEDRFGRSLTLPPTQGTLCEGEGEAPAEPTPKNERHEVPGFRIEDLVLFAERDGIFRTERELATPVKIGDVLGSISGEAIEANAEGVLRGLLHDGVKVKEGTKLIEIDPTGDVSRCYRISAKANAIAGGVLEAVFRLLQAEKKADVPSEACVAQAPSPVPRGV